MTVESYAQAPAYTISGVGPYPIPHPYLAGTIVAYVLIEDVPTKLDGAYFSVDPATAADQGNLLLTAAAAATHDGRTLWIERATPLEQGWMARDDGREAGMEAQLDQGTMSAQEDRSQINAALRARKPMSAFDPQPGRVPIVRADGDGWENGPSGDEVQAAQGYAEAAKASADRIDLGALDAAVAATDADATATAADRVQTGLDRQAAESAASTAAADANAQIAPNVASANAAEAGAIAARDAAFVNADVYADLTTGRAAVADGDQFQVVSGDEIIRYRRDSSTTQTEMARYPASTKFDSIPGLERAAGYSYLSNKLVEDSGSSVYADVYRNMGALVIGDTYELVTIVKAAERKFCRLYVNVNARMDVYFDLEKGIVHNEVWGTGAIAYLGGGRYECRVSAVATVANSANGQLMASLDGTAPPYAGDGASGIIVESYRALHNGVDLWPTDDVSDAGFTKLGSTVSTITVPRELASEELAQLKNAVASSNSSLFSGMKWAALGTSITDQNKYFPPLEALLGVTGQNLGVSGGSIAEGAHYGSLAIYNEIPNIASDADLVTIEAGTNDFGTRNSTLGALGDTTTATFYGALYAAVVAIQSQAPDAKIVFLTPYSADSRFPNWSITTTNADGDNFLDFQQAVRDVANYLGFPCIDIGSDGGFGYLTNGPITADGLHPNTLGGELFADYVYAKLQELAKGWGWA